MTWADVIYKLRKMKAADPAMFEHEPPSPEIIDGAAAVAIMLPTWGGPDRVHAGVNGEIIFEWVEIGEEYMEIEFSKSGSAELRWMKRNDATA